jgi:hypothetical protein
MRRRIALIAALCVPSVLSVTAGPSSALPQAPTCGGWTYQPMPEGYPPSQVSDVDVVPGTDQAWAVGYRNPSGSRPIAMLWDGSAWKISNPENRGISTTLYSVAAISASDVWAVGLWNDAIKIRTMIQHWNGSSWSVVPSPDVGSYNVLRSVAGVSANDVWAVGYDADPNPIATLVEHWDGTAWTVVASPNGSGTAQLNGVAVVGPDDVWAVGAHHWEASKSPQFAFAEHWDGSTWTLVSTPAPGQQSYLNAVTAIGPDDVWAVGREYARPGVFHALSEHWDGSAWTLVDADTGGESWHELLAVEAISSTDVWAVGQQYEFFSPFHTLAQHWDGVTWTMSPTLDGPFDTWLAGVAVTQDGSDVFAVGTRTAVGGVFGPHLEPVGELLC